MKIGIFGGTFDPVHRGHLQLAQSARAQFSLDKVIVVPAYLPPHKQELPLLTSAEDRYEMVRLAIEGEPFIEVSDCELQRKGVSYTFDTLSEFKEKYPGCEKSDSKYSDQYDKLIVEAFGGKGNNDVEKEDKIIKNIAKTVVIDKTNDNE
jgi:nicotinate (nicotinamide) nucleotide adenylyltransferase